VLCVARVVLQHATCPHGRGGGWLAAPRRRVCSHLSTHSLLCTPAPHATRADDYGYNSYWGRGNNHGYGDYPKDNNFGLKK
jgi:hypothetical protein